MGLFHKDEPIIEVVKPKRKKTAKEIIESAYVNTLKKNPNLQVKIAMKETGHYEDYKEETDPTIQQEREINKRVTEDALRMITTDPNLRKQYAEKVAERAIQGIGEKKNGSALTPAGQLIQSLREFRELKDELEGEGGTPVPSGWAAAFQQMLAQPEVATMLAAAIKQIILPAGQGAIIQPQRKYVVMVDDKLTELTESEYTEYVKIGRIKPIGLIEQPKKDERKDAKEVKATKPVNPELPEWAKDLPFETLEGYLELEPEEFVTQIKKEINSGENPNLQVFWNFLLTADYDTLVKVLEPYKKHVKAGKFIQSLIEKQEWVNSSIEIIKVTNLNEEI